MSIVTNIRNTSNYRRLELFVLFFALILSVNYVIKNVWYSRIPNVDSLSVDAANPPYRIKMMKDVDAKACQYSFRTSVMPEDIFDLDLKDSPGTQKLQYQQQDKSVFEYVHNILYGDLARNSIYSGITAQFMDLEKGSHPYTHLKSKLFNSILQNIDKRLTLKLVVEVGSFTGGSAIVMGDVLRTHSPTATILCIDTWLGALQSWLRRSLQKYLQIDSNGRPNVFYQFLRNMKENNLTETVLPISMSSLLGARFLNTYGLFPELVYLDSAHQQGETLVELSFYWNLLRPGGILFGDDWSFLSVRCDVKKFMYARGLKVELIDGTWFLKKPYLP